MFERRPNDLKILLQNNLLDTEFDWLLKTIEKTQLQATSRKLYLNYSLCGSRIQDEVLDDCDAVASDLRDYLKIQKASKKEIARIYLLCSVLSESSIFEEWVKKLIQVADTSELATFLKFLVLLPSPENYLFVAAEALRTNISVVFDAISKYNPYPATYFSEQQWNQMFLKAAFMQQDLGAIVAIDNRANVALASIISDYAHERWAASRAVDPMIWRPVSKFLNDDLFEDIKILLGSENIKEKQAGALICFHSDFGFAKDFLNTYPELKTSIESGKITWDSIND